MNTEWSSTSPTQASNFGILTALSCSTNATTKEIPSRSVIKLTHSTPRDGRAPSDPSTFLKERMSACSTKKPEKVNGLPTDNPALASMFLLVLKFKDDSINHIYKKTKYNIQICIQY